MRRAGQIVGVVMVGWCAALGGVAHAAASGPTAELSPDTRPVLLLEPPRGALLLARHARRRPLPASWRTGEPDRGFAAALTMLLSPGAANSPWRQLIVSKSGADTHSQLQMLEGQDAVVAVVHDDLVDQGGKVAYHVSMDVATIRAIATAQETRVHTPVQYFAAALTADSRVPRRSRAAFVSGGPLDGQVSTAATDLSQFLAAIVARVSVPASLRPHNPTLGELGVHPACGVCRAADPVVYQQPGRVWVRAGTPIGAILALPLPSARPPSSRTKEFGSPGIP
jgi:hypothetical protein